MKNLKIAKKLLITFGTIIALFCITVILAIASLRSTNENFETFYNVPYEITNRSMDMRRMIQSTSKNLGFAVMATDREMTASYVQSAQDDLQSLQDGITYMKANFRGDMSLINNIESVIANVSGQQDQVFQYALDMKNEEAAELFFEKVNPALLEAQEYLIKVNEVTRQNGDINFQDADNGALLATFLLIIISIVALIVIIIFAAYITKSLTGPIKEIETVANQMAEGQLQASLAYTSKDELGSLADSMRTMMDRISFYMGEISSSMDQLASGDLNVKKREDFLGDFKPVQLAIRTLVTSLNDAFLQINQSSDQVASGSDQVSSGAQALSQGATEQASAVEQLAATVNDISSQVKANADSAQQASHTADNVGAKIMESDQQMQEMTKAMDEISETSGKIEKIIKTIEDIAFQTNILALNAAVEAARAGAAGKGFAVVADEVRNLASKSAEASKNTSSLIESSLKAVEHGSEIADATAASLKAVVEGTKEITAQISQIASASEVQAQSIEQVTQGIDQISAVVQTNSATAEESAAASEELSGQSQMLKNLVGKFKLKGSATAASTIVYPSEPENTALQTPPALHSVSDKY